MNTFSGQKTTNVATVPKRTPEWVETMCRIVKSPSSKLGLALFVIIVFVCAFAPLLTKYKPTDMDLLHMYNSPNAEHIFGTDALGRDIFTRILYGGRYSLEMGLAASLFGTFVGVVFGSIAGFYGGKVESVIMRIMDVFSALPGMLLCILISASFGAGFFVTVVALAVGHIPGNTRMIRAQILSVRNQEYVEAAQTINCSDFSIMFRHIFPNVISPLIVSTTMSIGSTITSAAALSVIGLGVRPPTPEWGAMLSDARTHYLAYPYMILPPGLAIALTVLALNLLGDGLRDALDPKLRD